MIDDAIDFGAIQAEEEAKLNTLPVSLDGPKTEEDFLVDLLQDIDAQDIKDLDLDTVQQTGITTEEQAEWFIHEYKQAKEQAEKAQAAADKYMAQRQAKVNAWLKPQLKNLEWRMEWAKSNLEEYAKANIKGKKRSLKLIEGTIAFKKQQPAYEHNDDKIREFLSSVEGGKEFLTPQQPKVAWAQLKKAGTLDPNGIFRYGDQAVPGVVVTQRPDAFSVK